MNEVQGQQQFDLMQVAYEKLKEAEKPIEAGNAWWLDFKEHELAQKEYNRCLEEYLKAC